MLPVDTTLVLHIFLAYSKLSVLWLIYHFASRQVDHNFAEIVKLGVTHHVHDNDNDNDVTHHVHNLLQRQTEPQLHRLRLIGHRALQLLVVSHEVIQQLALPRPAVNTF